MLIRNHLITYLSTLSAVSLLSLTASAQDVDPDDDDDVNANALPEVRASSPSGRFGTEGQKAISSDVGMELSNRTVSGVDGSTTRLLLRPALDYFIADSVSIGGFVGVDYVSSPGGSSSVISLGPRVGYNVPTTERTSIWPKIGLAIARTDAENEGGLLPGDDDNESSTSVQLNLFAPFMFHPVQHFFLGLGPALDVDLSGDAKATTLAIRLTLGGWL